MSFNRVSRRRKSRKTCSDLIAVVGELVSFNRSATWVAPEFAGQLAADGRETIYSEEQKAEFRDHPDVLTKYRRDIEQGMNARFPAFYKYSEAQKFGRQVVSDVMKKRLKNDPVLVEKLIPKFELGCRR